MDLEMYSISSDSLDESLMHYGVKGMKWGVRKSGTERYRDREIKKLDKRYSNKRLNKRIARTASKIDKKMPKATGDDQRFKKLVKSAEKDSVKKYYREGMKAAETNKLKNMTVDQLKDEKMAVGKLHVANALSLIGGMAMADLVGVGYMEYDSPSVYKTDRRVSLREKADIIDKARGEASGDVESILETSFDNIGRKGKERTIWKPS